ncbi:MULTISPECIES: cytosine permease [Providencia]|uniref:cytosine permease n=1 Tax=Providencia TaxID=586 RepID=UPI0018E44127|nr:MULTISPECIES: cytosine permease [Providencia]EJD6378969.1 cytosine permease [Providencia rettgeri]EJF7713662.1 cytosine permease [Providencia rettgeri]ELR5117941.1 cytosine permease [Providencia rettgeri]MBI6202504.1 cytosine permease [Providencia rettgeri]MCG5279545.1 cytosine permease [Providencia rettgeri]
MSIKEKDNVLLDSEYEHVPVPLEHRKSFASVSAVWYSFPLVLTSAVIGGVVTAMLGFKMGVAAILVGNLLLCLVIGSLSYLAGKTGENFAISAKRTFGQRGYIAVSGLLATVVIGWFALMVGLTGDTMFRSFGQDLLLMTILGGVLYVGATFIGIKALAILGYIAAPMYLILGLISVYIAMKSGSSDIINYQPLAGAGALSFGVAVTMIFSTFTDSGTMTADFTRWAKNGKQGFLAAFTAFPISKFFAEVIGAIIVATGVVMHPEVTGGDFITILANSSPLLSILAIIFVFVNLGVGCTHCLYNGAVGWSHITKGKMRTLTIILGAIGIIVAVTGIWNAFQTWLNLLGLIVPPIAAIIIMDQLVLKRKNNEAKKWQPLAFISWILASGIALIVNAYAPELSVVVAGLISSSVIYWIGHQFSK